MKIAVPFANGEVFQHFGHTENFKLYEIEAGQVVSSEIIDTNGSGHDALAGFLADRSVNVLLCGGIGGGAQAALASVGIEICSGAEGDADAAVQAYLNGELQSAGANCDHHHDHGEDHHCGGGCGGCGGGCGGHAMPDIQGPNVGRLCKTHYRGTLKNVVGYDFCRLWLCNLVTAAIDPGGMGTPVLATYEFMADFSGFPRFSDPKRL